MKEHRFARLLGSVVIMAFLISAGAVSCGPNLGAPPEPPPGGPPGGEQPPGGQLPGEQPPGGPVPGGELQLVLVADPDMVPPGGCAILHWEVAPPGEYRVLLNGQQVPPLGEQQVCPPGTTTYELLVETPGGPEVRTVTVNVGGPGGGPQPPTPGGGPGQPPTPGLGPPPTGGPGEGCAGAPTFSYFTASASSISAGQQVQLSWGPVTNGTSGPLVGSVVLSPGGFGEVGSPGSRWASPTTTTTYRLTATGCGGTATKDVTVTVGGSGTAATATPHPGGPTATKPAAGPTATKPAAGPTATPTTAVILGTVIPFVPVPTATTGSTTAAVQLTNKCGRNIQSVYIRKKGESDWGSDRLAQSGSIGPGAARTFQVGSGDFQMRALCCGGLVVSEHSVTLSSGTYDWTVIAALDIHNNIDAEYQVDKQIETLYIMPWPQNDWGDDLLEQEPSWPGCSNYGGQRVIPGGESLRCFLYPGRYYLRAISRYGMVYTASYVNVQGNSAWYVATEFWTPPAD
jgi:hypothetical protein